MRVEDLRLRFPLARGLFGCVERYVKAGDGVSFDLYRGETLGLVGESGCGKAMVGRAIYAPLRTRRPDSLLAAGDGRRGPRSRMDQGALRGVRHHCQMIFPDPYASLNPRRNMLDIAGEPLRLQGERNRAAG